jgi:hypothetical protein
MSTLLTAIATEVLTALLVALITAAARRLFSGRTAAA